MICTLIEFFRNAIELPSLYGVLRVPRALFFGVWLPRSSGSRRKWLYRTLTTCQQHRVLVYRLHCLFDIVTMFYIVLS